LILPVNFICSVIFCTYLFLLKTSKALGGLLCADVPLRNYSLTHCVCFRQGVANKLTQKARH